LKQNSGPLGETVVLLINGRERAQNLRRTADARPPETPPPPPPAPKVTWEMAVLIPLKTGSGAREQEMYYIECTLCAMNSALASKIQKENT